MHEKRLQKKNNFKQSKGRKTISCEISDLWCDGDDSKINNLLEQL